MLEAKAPRKTIRKVRCRRAESAVPVVLITYATAESAIRTALDAVTADGHIAEPPQVIRIERE